MCICAITFTFNYIILWCGLKIRDLVSLKKVEKEWFSSLKSPKIDIVLLHQPDLLL